MQLKNMFWRMILLSCACLALPLDVGAADKARANSLGKTRTNSIGMEFVLIPAGSFIMGSDKALDKDAEDDETPQHKVTISRPFYLGRYEVTQAQWIAVMGGSRLWFEPDHPIDGESWEDVQEFIKRLNQKEGDTRYRLPTEAEWEYAARAGTTTRYSFGDDIKQLGQYAAWCSHHETYPVGQKAPNPWGLYDMHGNVREWVQDWYDENYYRDSPATDPKGPSEGDDRVLRGGYWNVPSLCRAANRDSYPQERGYGGFRVAISVEREKKSSNKEEVKSPIPPKVLLPSHTNSLGMEFVKIPAGSFVMGTDENDIEHENNYDETPLYEVTITRPFYLGKYEVTQAQWVAVMGENPSHFKGKNHPVENVSWEDIQAFIQRLNRKEGHTRYRLPTEAEWEYAARAGSTGEYSFGDDAKQMGQYAWYKRNADKKTHPVGQKAPNDWGLYDIHGNVREWVQDAYGEDYYYRIAPAAVDPTGPPEGSDRWYRVSRGGGWSSAASDCRVANRTFGTPVAQDEDLGFRLAISVE